MLCFWSISYLADNFLLFIFQYKFLCTNVGKFNSAAYGILFVMMPYNLFE